MKKMILGIAALACVCLSRFDGTVEASIINPGFETGDLTGWTSSSVTNATVVTSHVGNSGTYSPTAGNYMLAIAAGVANEWQTVSQTVSLGAGDTLSGAYAFDWRDYTPYLDGLRVSIYDANSAAVFQIDVDGSDFPFDYFDGPWTNWSWTSSAAGSYTLEYGVRNTIDAANSSVGLFDTATVTAIPEPGSLLVWGVLGLAGVGLTDRRRKS